MIIDLIDNASQYSPLMPKLPLALAWLKQQDLSGIADGRYVIDGDSVYAIVTTVDPKNQAEGKFEAHRRYIDCHYVFQGNETIAYAPVNNLTAETDFDAANDFSFLKGDGTCFKIKENQFWAAFPGDGHWPALRTGDAGQLRKIIFKIELHPVKSPDSKH